MDLRTSIIVTVVAFVLMEPFTAGTHRWVMHGCGAFLHRSHHRRSTSRFERNDWYPVIFAAVVNVGFFAGFNWRGFGVLVPVGIGITAYGALYALVHDVYIHRRVGWLARRCADRDLGVLRHLADAHRIHHLYGSAPFGMLLPVVPADLRRRAEARERSAGDDRRALEPLG